MLQHSLAHEHIRRRSGHVLVHSDVLSASEKKFTHKVAHSIKEFSISFLF